MKKEQTKPTQLKQGKTELMMLLKRGCFHVEFISDDHIRVVNAGNPVRFFGTEWNVMLNLNLVNGTWCAAHHLGSTRPEGQRKARPDRTAISAAGAARIASEITEGVNQNCITAAWKSCAEAAGNVSKMKRRIELRATAMQLKAELDEVTGQLQELK